MRFKAFKKIMLIVVSLLLVVSMVGCGSNSKPDSNQSGSGNSDPSNSSASQNSSTPAPSLKPSDNIPADDSAVVALSYPAPNMTESPQLLKDFPLPSANIPMGFSKNYNLNFSGKTTGGAPEIATITEQAGPSDSVSIYGTGFNGAKVYAYGLVGGKGTTKQLKTTSQRADYINAVIDPAFQYGVYIIWIQGANGAVSTPVRINAPEITWISASSASENAEIRVYGKFLTANNADGKDASSNVFITSGKSYYLATVLEASPYRLTIKLPSGLENNKSYKVWVHNGHGGNYGWSNSTSIVYSSSAEKFFGSNKKTVKVTNGRATDEDITAAINSANSGDTIYLPAGTYVINDEIRVNKSLRFQGEDKEKVILVCMFGQSRQKNNTLAYGDWNVNSGATAAFTVKATPCEFTGITFTDYVRNSKLYSGVSAPSGYNLDYAHGVFISGEESHSDTGVSGQLKIDGCKFLVQRTYSKVTNSPYFGESEKQTRHRKHSANYTYYSTNNYGSAPLWIHTNRTEIVNCYFESPKEIFTRNMDSGYIAGNTFVGTWVIDGNSGPCAIYDNSSLNIDISNNRIYGMDEVTDPNGYVKTGDQTYARTIVLQKTMGAAQNQYIMNNNVSRVGELNYNSGEHILFEEEGITYVGKATLSNNNKTLYLKDMPTDKWSGSQVKGYITGNNGEIKPGYTRSVKGQVVIISNGRGQGQWRTIASASANRTVTIDRDWDVQPDENSTFAVVPAFINPVVYNNTIEGPEIYYKNYNSTNGVNAYGSMVGTVIDRNRFSQMQAGIVINPHYNMKTYVYNGKAVQVDFNFVMFAEMLVMNNTISNTRYGIWNFPSITLDGMDAVDAAATLDLQLCSVIRGNNISGQRKLVSGADTNNTVNAALIRRGGAAIVVGRDYWDPYQVLSTRHWLNDIVVENNALSNVANNNGNGFIDVSFSQNNTIIRNNTYNGQKKATYAEVEVERNSRPHKSNKTPTSPVYFAN